MSWFMAASLLAVAISVGSAFLTVRRLPSRRIANLEIEVADLRAAYERLLESHKRLRSAEGMRELRDRRRDEAEDDARTPARKTGKVAHPAGSRARLRQEMGVPDSQIGLLNENLRRNGLA